jgi:pyrroloquinoline-quinone synthase
MSTSMSALPLASNRLDSFLEQQRCFVLEHRGTRHPFLLSYRDAGLRAEATRMCFLEFYQFINDYPFYLSILGGRMQYMEFLREISRIMADEVGAFQGKPHLTIYREFLRALGIAEDEIDSYQPLPTSVAMNQHVRNAYTQRPLAEAAGTLFGLETMASDMMDCLNEGLRASGYGAEVRHFFEIHVSLEKNHSDEGFAAARPLFRGDAATRARNEALFEKGVQDFMERLDGFWTAIGHKTGLMR